MTKITKTMTSKAISANQTNAGKSTGPKRTRWTRFNPVKHGILSRSLPFRDPAESADFNRHVNSLIRDLLPSNSLELTLVEEIAVCNFKLRRLNGLELTEFEARRQASQAILQGAQVDPNGLRPFEVPPTAWDCAELKIQSEKVSSNQDRGVWDGPSAKTAQVRFEARFDPSLETILRYSAQVQRDRHRAIRTLSALQAGGFDPREA